MYFFIRCRKMQVDTKYVTAFNIVFTELCFYHKANKLSQMVKRNSIKSLYLPTKCGYFSSADVSKLLCRCLCSQSHTPNCVVTKPQKLSLSLCFLIH